MVKEDPKQQFVSRTQLIELGFVLVITTIAYTPVLFNFFVGDDFVHLSWLSKCLHDPSMLLWNFNHSWLDVITTKFYRPLISVFMFTDYLVWRTNGFGFHLTNLLFHLANCCLVFAITAVFAGVVSEIGKAGNADVKGRICPSWPLLAAVLFGLYPLHAEAVSWITGRVDTIVTTFYLAAFWLYMQWSERRKLPYLVMSLLSTVLALMSKEMAITIPLMVLAWELFRGEAARAENFDSSIKSIKSALVRTAPFWLLLLVYFGVRRVALGTFVGGYDNSLFFVPNVHTFISSWLHSIRMTLVPINREVTGDHNIFTIGWCIGMLLALCGIVKSALSTAFRKTTIMLMLLTVISIIPVYKIFTISDDLESSRLVYLTSSFLCILLAAGLTNLFRNFATTPEAVNISGPDTVKNIVKDPDQCGPKTCWSKARIGTITMAALFIGCAFTLLWRNNQVWRHAGLECTAIRSSLELISKTLPEDTHMLLVDLPDQFHGAYICRNATPGIIEPPQFDKKLRDCIFLNTYDPVFPFGFLKRSLQENSQAVKIFAWNSSQQQFQTISLPSGPVAGSEANATAQSFKFKSARVPCWSSDFIFMPDSPAKTPEKAPSILDFQNEISDGKKEPGSTKRAIGFEFKEGDQTGKIYPLRANSLWGLGGQGQLAVPNSGTPNESKESFMILPPTVLMPTLDFPNSGYLGSKGFLHLSTKHPTEKISCLHNDVPNADHFDLEILRPNQFLSPSDCNSTEPSNQKLKEIKGEQRTGFLQLNTTDFMGPGLYQARLWSADKDDHHLGVAGDHIIISIDP